MIASTGAAPAENVAGAFPDRAAWNRVVVETDATFLHSWEWGNARCQSAERTLWFYSDDARVRSAMVLTIKQIAPGLKLLWSPDGLFFSGDEAVFLQRLQQFLHEHHVWGVLTKFRTAAAWDNSSPAVKRVSMQLWLPRPTETLVLDISPDEEVLYANIRRSLREQIRAVQRRDITVQEQSAHPVGDFWDMYHTTAKTRGFQEYKNENFLTRLVAAFSRCAGSTTPVHLFWLTAQRNGEHLAHYIGGVAGSQALQIWSTATPDGLQVGAKKLLQWEAIRMAKKLGARFYDFGGFNRKVTPGVFEFKRGFGGVPVRSSSLLFLGAATMPRLRQRIRAADSDISALDVTDPGDWDKGIGQSEGAHPLQCWAWGEARRADSVGVVRVAVYEAGRARGFAQILVRQKAGYRIGWIPGGPMLDPGADADRVLRTMLHRAASAGVRMSIAQPYLPMRAGWTFPSATRPQTFWLDLLQPLDVLEKNLHKEWRRGELQFVRKGGNVIDDTSDEALEDFVVQYAALVSRKAFERYGDEGFIRRVWASFRQFGSPFAGVHVFKAIISGKCAASAIVLRAGATAHFAWGASDYEMRNTRANEGLQWGIVRHLRELGLRRYDLGGVDANRNPGVFEF